MSTKTMFRMTQWKGDPPYHYEEIEVTKCTETTVQFNDERPSFNGKPCIVKVREKRHSEFHRWFNTRLEVAVFVRQRCLTLLERARTLKEKAEESLKRADELIASLTAENSHAD